MSYFLLTDQGYNQELQHLASKARIKNNDRYTLIAFLYIEYLNTHICVIQHSSAKYLTFKFYGLFQEKKESIEKSIFTIDFINKLFENGYIIRNVKMDIAFDFNLYFDETIHIFLPICIYRRTWSPKSETLGQFM